MTPAAKKIAEETARLAATAADKEIARFLVLLLREMEGGSAYQPVSRLHLVDALKRFMDGEAA